jgi:hypothetical protein
VGRHRHPAGTAVMRSGLGAGTRGVAAVIVGLLAASMMIWQSSRAAFTATTTNTNNSFTAGSVTITDSTGSAMFSPTNLTPASTGTACIGVKYAGSVTAPTIRLYTSGAQEANNGGGYAAWANDNTSEMDNNLSMEILIGSTDLGSDPGSNCAAETGSFTDVAGAAPGTTLRTMIANNTSFSNGLASQWGTITPNKWRVWKFIYTMSASAPSSAQGDGLKVNLVWEADS